MDEVAPISASTKVRYKKLQEFSLRIIRVKTEWTTCVDNANTTAKSIDALLDQVDNVENVDISSFSFDKYSSNVKEIVSSNLMDTVRIEIEKIRQSLFKLESLLAEVKSVVAKSESEFDNEIRTFNSDVVGFYTQISDVVEWFDDIYVFLNNDFLNRKKMIYCCESGKSSQLQKEWTIKWSNEIEIIFYYITQLAQLDLQTSDRLNISNDKSKVSIKSDKSIVNDQSSRLQNKSHNSSRKNFEQEKRFHGIVLPKGLNNLMDKVKIDNRFQDTFVALASKIMRLYSISLGHLVLLTNSSGRQIIRIACLNSDLNEEIGLTSQTFLNFGLYSGEIVSVEPYYDSVIPATKITLKVVGKFKLKSYKNFTSYLINREHGKCVIVGNRFFLRYLGNDHEFVVTRIKGEGICVSLQDLEQFSIDSITKSMEGIKIHTSTPIKTTQDTGLIKYSNVVPCVRIVSETKLVIEKSDVAEENENLSLSYNQLGGVSSQIEKMEKIIKECQDPLRRNYSSVGILVHGPTGVGKSLLCQTVAFENKLFSLMVVNGATDILKTHFGESESSLKEIFEESQLRSPTIILFENIDEWCPGEKIDFGSSQFIRIVNTFVTEMNNLRDTDSVVVVLATTNKINNLDPALRRPGVFDYEIEIGMPTVKNRQEILTKILSPFTHHLTENDILAVAEVTHGFTGADLNALVREAFSKATDFVTCKNEFGESVKLTLDALLTSVKEIPITVMRELAIEVPKVYWKDIAGYEDVKLKIRQSVEWAIKHPEVFQKLGIRPIRGILLYGPPGCSKTLMAKAVATESGLNFISINVTGIYSKYVGESEQAVRDLFQAARKAAPSVLFFDEIDALVPRRGSVGSGGQLESRILSQLLTEMDSSIHLQMTVVIAATNRPDLLDKALTRPGRFDRLIYVSLPDLNTRRQMFQLQFERFKIDNEEILDELVQKTENYSGAEIVDIYGNEIVKTLMKDNCKAKEISGKELLTAIENHKPTTSSSLIRICETFKVSSR